MLWKIITAAGILSFLYYLLLCMVLRKWNSTFSRFWILLGALLLLVGYLKIEILVFVLILPVIFFLIVEMLIVFAMLTKEKEELSYLIVLGAQVRGKKLTDSLYRRIKRAEEYMKKNPDTVAIVSGGQGKGEDITEAQAMERCLLANGIEAKRVLKEYHSMTTEENLKFSSVYIKDKSMPVGIVSNNFHMYRALQYAKKLGYQNVCAVPAGCHPVLFLNYMVREFFAVCKMWFL